MNTPIDYLSPIEIGERLRVAREATGLKQGPAAGAIDMSRTTLIAIEQGQRRVRTDELLKLSKLYGTSVNALMRVQAIHVDLSPKFRKVVGDRDETGRAASQLLADLAKAEVELEDLLGVSRVRNYPPERPIGSGDITLQAEHDALELRQRTGLGLSPVADIISLLELELGVRVYIRRLDGHVSGLFAYDEKLGACILLNARHPRERRTFTAAHELGHLISTRREPDVLHDQSPERTPEERYCNAFARAFMMPHRGVMQKFKDFTAGSPRLTRRHIIVLAHYFNVSREAVSRRLEELKLTKPGTWDWFEENGGITDAQAHQVLGDLVPTDTAKAEAEQPTTLRLNMLASEAWRQSLLTEGQLMRLLHLDRVELRRLLDRTDIEGEADEAPVLSV
jgi:Zn-dependent peptidase ImmA (M78 family)/DNA-binding XRE family transcriptional regulator